LKSPDSAKRIQGNPSFFSWIPLVFLGSYLAAKAEPRPRADVSAAA